MVGTKDIASTARALPNTRYRGDSDLVFRSFDASGGMSMSMMMADTDRDREVYLIQWITGTL